jgi:hypothetical protein
VHRQRKKRIKWRKINGWIWDTKMVQVSEHCWVEIKVPVKIIYEGDKWGD